MVWQLWFVQVWLGRFWFVKVWQLRSGVVRSVRVCFGLLRYGNFFEEVTCGL